MEYLSEVILLLVAGVNITLIMATCILNTGIKKHPQKRNMMAAIAMLSINFILDVACFVGFVCYGMAEDAKIFGLFFPLTVILLYEAIKELRETAR